MVDLGPKRLPLVEADAKGRAIAWRGKQNEQVRLGDLLAVRLSLDGTTATLAQRPALQGSRMGDRGWICWTHLDDVARKLRSAVYDHCAPRRQQFDDCATQAHRQVGSSIKPFIYSAFIESGRTPVEHMHDGPFSVQTATGTWTPANYGNKYLGDVTLMTALAFSLNTTIRRPDRGPLGRPRS